MAASAICGLKSGAILTRRAGDHLVATRINGKYWMYWGEGSVHAATSTDLVHWDPIVDAKGDLVTLLAPRPGHFDSALCESGPPALLTAKGILFLYNGKNADGTGGDPSLKPGTYSGGQALFDAHDPTRLLARSDTLLFHPGTPLREVRPVRRRHGLYRGPGAFPKPLAALLRHRRLPRRDRLYRPCAVVATAAGV